MDQHMGKPIGKPKPKPPTKTQTTSKRDLEPSHVLNATPSQPPSPHPTTYPTNHPNPTNHGPTYGETNRKTQTQTNHQNTNNFQRGFGTFSFLPVTPSQPPCPHPNTYPTSPPNPTNHGPTYGEINRKTQAHTPHTQTKTLSKGIWNQTLLKSKSKPPCK